MRKLITSFIGPNVAQPIKQGTLDHLQLAYQEAINALGRMGIGQDYDPTKVYVLYGCENTNTAPNYDINAGAIFYGGEIYLLDAVSFVAADTAVGTITTSYFASAIADPVTFTDGVAHNVHEIKKMVVADAVSGSGTADYDDWVSSEWKVSTSTAGATVGVSTGTYSFMNLKYKVEGSKVILNFGFTVNTTVAGATLKATIPLPVPALTSSSTRWDTACMYNDGNFTYYTIVHASVNENYNQEDKLICNVPFAPALGSCFFAGQIIYEKG